MKDVNISQAAGKLLMIRPDHFGFNAETSGSNIFQKNIAKEEKEVSGKAVAEFNHFVSLLNKYEIDVVVIDDLQENKSPDSVFPNNWFSTHADGTVILYPMLAANRRLERRRDIFKILENVFDFEINKTEDLSYFEQQNKFCEGTGSLVFDHANKIAYCNLSSRTNKEVATHVCSLLNYEPVFFTAKSKEGEEIYHTNVMLTVAENFAVICAESIEDVNRQMVLEKLVSTGHEIIAITLEQMIKFAGNMLQVKNKRGELITILSKTAFDCLDEVQLEMILKHSKMLPVPVPLIEEVGGGSVRCMMAEVFMPKS